MDPQLLRKPEIKPLTPEELAEVEAAQVEQAPSPRNTGESVNPVLSSPSPAATSLAGALSKGAERLLILTYAALCCLMERARVTDEEFAASVHATMERLARGAQPAATSDAASPAGDGAKGATE
jgi:hypothetical protein